MLETALSLAAIVLKKKILNNPLMHFFRIKNQSRRLISLLILGMLLRSLIAPGYMLDTNTENAQLFSITICAGPAGINAIPGLHETEHSHHHHQHDADHEQHNHESAEHGFSACSLWSSSSLSLLAELDFNHVPGIKFSDNTAVYQHLFNKRFLNNSHPVRAPPFHSLVV